MMPDKPTKCWMTFSKCRDCESIDLVHANTRAQAIYRSEWYAEDREWNDVRAVRAPKLDGLVLTDENIRASGYVQYDEEE